MSMKRDILLAIETSGLMGGVGLADGGALLGVKSLSADRRHTSELMPTIADLLTEHGLRLADVRVFAYSTGPGSFTGLRVAATIGRMIQSTVNCEVVAVPTLEVIARNALYHPDKPRTIVAILDAKRGQVYGAAFERVDSDQLHSLVEADLYDPAELFTRVDPPFCIIGEGARNHADSCAASAGTVLAAELWPPSAEQVIAIARRMASAGEFCAPDQIIPRYIRPPECEEVYEKRRAEARARRGE